MKRIILTAITALLTFVTISAQWENVSEQDRYTSAERYFDLGFFPHVEEMVKPLLRSSNMLVRTGAYRLMALCRLEQGDVEGARNYVGQLLKNDPYFTPTYNDPQRFIDLIRENKSEEAGITTASRQSETLEEAPVPVTLITEDMIRHSGASNLQELLCLFVPGMTLAEGLESNIAMHGIYSLFQDKVLFMVDGHRLNSSSTNAESPDFRSELDKIQQIEVLRGPASSLYGNVALTAVVNIITRKGAALNGGRVRGTWGTQSTAGGGLVLGAGNNVVDVMGWGSIYGSKGYASYIDNGLGGKNKVYSNGFRDRPSYDLGLRARWSDFTFSLNMQRSKRVPYINVIQLPATITLADVILNETRNYDAAKNFNYDDYSNLGGDGPGVTRTNNRVTLDYSHSFGSFEIQAGGYLSMERTSFYNVLGDSIDRTLGSLMLAQLDISGVAMSPERVPVKGVMEKLDWENYAIGGQAQLLTNYNLWGKGSAIFGVQFEYLHLQDGTFYIGGNYNGSAMLSSNNVFRKGNENIASAYAQIKHYFSPRFIFNAGLRYDHKKRFDAKELDKLSPRLSLIYKIDNALSVRGSYNHSLVDAPYILRACLINMFSGGPDMKPEMMDAFQVGATYHKAHSPFSAEVSMFYNVLSDLAVLNASMRAKPGTDSEPYIFVNAGKVKEIGVEGSVNYQTSRLLMNGNATWQRIMSSEDYSVHEGNTYGTPEFVAKGLVAYAPYEGKGNGLLNGGKLWLRGSADFQTKTYYQTLDLFSSFANEEFINVFTEVKPQVKCNIGVGYEWKHLDIDLSVKNVFNTQYKIGSMLIDGIPHPGRQFLGRVTVKF